MPNPRPILLGAALLAVALATRSICAVGPEDKPAPPIVLFAQGVAAFHEGQFEKARSSFQQVIASEPRHAEGLYYLGVCEAKLRNYVSALARLSEAVACDATLAPRLRGDGYLSAAESDETFSRGVAEILARVDRRERGDVAGLAFEFKLQDAEGKEHRVTDFAGTPLIVLFLDDSSGNSLDAGIVVDRMRASDGVDLRAIAVVRVRGKTITHQVSALESYASSSGLGFPLVLSDGAVEQQLRPFRKYPSALFLDRKGRPRRLVEGHGSELEARYRAALAEVTAEEDRESAQPAEPERPAGSSTRPAGTSTRPAGS